MGERGKGVVKRGQGPRSAEAAPIVSCGAMNQALFMEEQKCLANVCVQVYVCEFTVQV